MSDTPRPPPSVHRRARTPREDPQDRYARGRRIVSAATLGLGALGILTAGAIAIGVAHAAHDEAAIPSTTSSSTTIDTATGTSGDLTDSVDSDTTGPGSNSVSPGSGPPGTTSGAS